MKKMRERIIAGVKLEEFDWNGRRVVFKDKKQVIMSFDELVKQMEYRLEMMRQLEVRRQESIRARINS